MKHMIKLIVAGFIGCASVALQSSESRVVIAIDNVALLNDETHSSEAWTFYSDLFNGNEERVRYSFSPSLIPRGEHMCLTSSFIDFYTGKKLLKKDVLSTYCSITPFEAFCLGILNRLIRNRLERFVKKNKSTVFKKNDCFGKEFARYLKRTLSGKVVTLSPALERIVDMFSAYNINCNTDQNAIKAINKSDNFKNSKKYIGQLVGECLKRDITHFIDDLSKKVEKIEENKYLVAASLLGRRKSVDQNYHLYVAIVSIDYQGEYQVRRTYPFPSDPSDSYTLLLYMPQVKNKRDLF